MFRCLGGSNKIERWKVKGGGYSNELVNGVTRAARLVPFDVSASGAMGTEECLCNLARNDATGIAGWVMLAC